MSSRKIENAKEFGKVAVLMGGHSAEREISLISGQAVLESLQRQNIDAYRIDGNANLLDELGQNQFDRAFNVLHGRGGEDGQIQGFLQTIQLPYTGSGVAASVLSMNKRISKQNWQQLGLPTAQYVSVNVDTDIEDVIAILGLPLIIKPVNEGSSIGMSKVSDANGLKQAITLALQYDTDVIAEQWITGQEYTVAILDGQALPVIRLQTPNAFYDYEAKYQSETTQYHCPCGLSEQEEKQCQALALKAFEALGMRGWGRIDFMCDQSGQFYLLEANSVPGMTDHSLVPMAAKQAGMDFDALVWKILETSFEGDK